MAIDNVDTVLREVALLVIGNGYDGVIRSSVYELPDLSAKRV